MADSTRRVSVRLSLDDAARVKAELRDVGDAGQRSLERIQDGADKASRALSLMDVAVRGAQIAGVAVAARALVQAGDTMTQSLFRLQTATGSVERASAVYEALYRSALQTGVAVSESADAFQRFSIAARAIGATSSQVTQLVTGIQRVAIVSGASTSEISSATLQLSQALASGVLQGDELRSILEAMPLLAEGLARELGVSVGQLRQLGSEGKLTAERVFPALLRATQRIGAELDKAPLSLSRAFGQLTAATDNFLGQLDRAIGLSNTLARALSGAARALDGVRQGAGLLSDTERLAAQRRQLEELGNEIGRLEAQNDGRPSLRSQTRRGSIRPGLVGAAQSQAGVTPAQRLDELRQQYFSLLADIDTAERAAATSAATEREQAAQQAAEARRTRAAQDITALTTDLDARFKIEREYQDRLRRLREAEAAGGVQPGERQRLEALATTERDEALRKLEGTTRRVTSAQRENRDAERETNEVLRERERLIQQNETAYEKYVRRLESLGSLADRARRAGQPLPDETINREAERALAELEQGGKRLEEPTQRGSDAARELGISFTSAFEEAVLQSKKLSDVLDGLVADITRIALRRSVTEPLANLLTGAFGGGSTGGTFDLSKAITTGFGLLAGGGGVKAARGAVLDRMGVVPFARGGIVDRPTMFPFAKGVGLMGEAGPEAIMPLRRTSDGRLGVEASGGGRVLAPTMVFNISTPDPGGFRRSEAQLGAAAHRMLSRAARAV